MADYEQGIVIRVTAEGTLEVTKLSQEFDKLKASAASANQVSAQLGSTFSQSTSAANETVVAFKQLGIQLASVAIGWVSVSAAIRGVMAGLREYDTVRDVTRAIAGMTGGFDNARRTMAFFEDAMDRTRATGTELALQYQEVLPLAIRQGWLPRLHEVIVLLNQVAVAANRAPEAMITGFRQLLMIGPSSRNQLLQAIGMTADDLRRSGDAVGTFLAKLREMAKIGEDAGDSFASAGKKIREAFASAFAEGFGKQFDDGAGKLKGLTDAIKDPTLLEAIRSIGEAFALILKGPIADLVKAVGRILADIKYAAGWVGEHAIGGAPTEMPSNVPGIEPYQGRGQIITGQAAIDYFRQRSRIARPYGPSALGVTPGFSFLDMPSIEEAISTPKYPSLFPEVVAPGAEGTPEFGKFRQGAQEASKAAEVLAESMKRVDAEWIDLFNTTRDLELKFRPPIVDPVLRALQEVKDKYDGITQGLDAKILAAEDRYDAALAKRTVAIETLAKAQKEGGATPEQVATINATIKAQTDEMEAAQNAAAGYKELRDVKVPYFEQLETERVRVEETAKAVEAAEEPYRKYFNTIQESARAAAEEIATFNGEVQAIAAPKLQQLTTTAAQIPYALAALVGTGGGALAQVNPAVWQTLLDVAAKMADAEFKGLVKGGAAVNRSIDEAFKDAEAGLSSIFAQFGQDVGAIFTDLAETGGKNFGEIAARSISAGVGRMGETLWKNFSDYFAVTKNEAGQWVYRGVSYTSPQGAAGARSEDIAAYAPATVQGLTGLFMLGTAISQGGLSAGGAILGGAQLGMTAGSAVGMIGGAGGYAAGTAGAAAAGSLIGAGIGLIIGAALYFALKPDPQLIRYFQPSLKEGIWEMIATGAELTPTEKAKYLRELQTQWDAFYNTYAAIMANIPLDVLAQISGWITAAMNQNVTNWPVFSAAIGAAGRTWLEPGSAEYAASQQEFYAAWNEFIEGELPRETMQTFKPAFAEAFQLMGGTLEKFNEYWNYARTLNPDEAVQYVKAMMSAMAIFHKNVEQMTTLSRWQLGQEYIGGRLQRRDESEFLANLRAGSENLFQIAAVVATTFGPTQAMAAEQLGQGIETVLSNLADYLTRISQLSTQLNQSIADLRFQAGFQMIGSDKNAQMRYLQTEYTRVLQAAQVALDPDKAYEYYQRAASLATQIWQLDPKGRYDWYMEQLTLIENYSAETFRRIGEAAQDAVSALIVQLQPFVDFFTGMPVDLEPAIESTIGAFEGATEALLILKQRIESGVTTPTGPGGAGGGAPNTYAFGDGSRNNPYRNTETFDPSKTYMTNGVYYTWGTPPGAETTPPPGTGGAGTGGQGYWSFDPETGFPYWNPPPGTGGGGGTRPPPHGPPGSGQRRTGAPTAEDKRVSVTVNLNGPIYDSRDLANVVIRELRRNPRLLEPN